jgi:cupin fold WbuC family metalloprotein
MVKKITAQSLDHLQAEAATASRLRAHMNIHESLDAAVQRLFIATEPQTYMRPHRHPQDHKWELFIVLDGSIDLLLFDASGTLIERVQMAADAVRAVEVPPGTWHAYVCQQAGTLALEIKQDAYIATPEEDFAPWAPVEGSLAAQDYLQWMRTALAGSSYTAS